MENFIVNVGLVFTISFSSSLAIVIWFQHFISKSITRNDIKAIQASHVTPVARIGGLSIMLALTLVTVPFLEISINWPNYSLLLLSAFPVFLTGLCEDLGYFSRPRIRLLASVFSGVVFVGLFKMWLIRTDIPGMDLIILWAPTGIGFSLFLAAGINHAFNLIDGLNGLAGFTAVGVAVSLAVISHQVGLTGHRDVLIILISAIAGFLVLNFPFGKIFLGDGGAYVIGHILVWMAISILYATPNVTPLAILLIFFFPVMDTLLAIFRRVYLRVPISHPDRLHLHQLVRRGVEILALGSKQRHIANPLSTVLLLPIVYIPMVAGVLLMMDRINAMIALIIFTTLFCSFYKTCIWLARRFRRPA